MKTKHYIVLYTRASLAGGWAPPATLAEGGMDIQLKGGKEAQMAQLAT